jgi:small-conductance mechanosensitive channel
VFVLYFLPPFLSIILNAALRGYAKRNATREDRLKEMRNEVDKVRAGLHKTIVFLIILLAAVHAMSLVDCSTETRIEWRESDIYPYQSEQFLVEEEPTELCEYLEDALLVANCLIILVSALLLTTITPLFIYMFSKSTGDVRKSNLYRAGVYINYLILMFAFFIILNFVGLDLSASIAFGSNTITLWDIISAAVIVILSNIIAKLVTAILRDTALNPRQMEEHASILMEKVIHVVIVLIGFGIAMSILGINILAISLATGLIGFALAFGMQDTIANIVGGIVLAMEKPFKIGDRIRVGNDWGDVIDIGMRSTKIRTVKNETVVIPNSLVVTNEVWNFTKDSPVLANVIPIGISYDSDPKVAEEIILEIAKQHPLVIDSPPAHVRLVNYGESSVDLELWAWIGNARKREIVRSDLLKSIMDEFNRRGISIPFPHRTLLFKGESGGAISDRLRGK